MGTITQKNKDKVQVSCVKRSGHAPSKSMGRYYKLKEESFRGPSSFDLALKSLGLKKTKKDKLIRLLETGFPFSCAEHFQKRIGLTLKELSEMIQISERSLDRRKANKKLHPEESERLFRIAHIYELAFDLFEGNEDDAVQWLTTPKNALNNNAPLHYSKTEIGAREVEDLIGRLEEGVF